VSPETLFFREQRPLREEAADQARQRRRLADEEAEAKRFRRGLGPSFQPTSLVPRTTSELEEAALAGAGTPPPNFSFSF